MKIKEIIKKNKFATLLYRFLLKYKKLQNNFIINYYKTDFSRNALVSYITEPFIKSEYNSHTNGQESILIAKSLHNLGFNIDIIDCDSEKKLPLNKYSLVLGFGKPYKHLVENADIKSKKIFYSTGMPPYFSNKQTILRNKQFSKKSNKLILESSRYINDDYSSQILLSDYIVTLGNQYVKKLYTDYTEIPVHLLPPSFFKICEFEDILKKKNFHNAKNNFLFFSGGGLIHKGLDLVLEYFSTRTDINLHICCSIVNEKEFESFYKILLYKTQNIIFHGFININSKLFKKLLNECAFVIFPSCSEGGGASVINVLGNGGLVPIVTAESSIPINDFGIPIDGFNQTDISSAMERAMLISDEEIKNMSYRCGNFISINNSIENFEKNINIILAKI